MKSFGTGMALLAALNMLMACSDDSMDGQALGPDGGLAMSADASPPANVPDAAPAVPDASTEEPVDPGDFPIELACELDEIQPLFECVADNCLEDIADGNILTCVTLSCGLLLLTLPPECTQCIFTGLGDPSMALDACVLGLDDLGGGGGFPFPPLPQP